MLAGISLLARAALALLACSTTASAILLDFPSEFGDGFAPDVSFTNETEAVVSGGFGKRALDYPLRIMPFGASITSGYIHGVKGDGYRRPLRYQLRHKGYEVNFVGDFADGSMKDRDHQGTPGITTGGLTEQTESVGAYKPNVVLINVGTNDCTPGNGFETRAYATYKYLVDKIFKQAPNTFVVLSTLLPRSDGGYRTICTDLANENIRRLVREYEKSDQIALADMNTGFITTSVDPSDAANNDFSDDIHPSPRGYEKMAGVWWAAIEKSIGKIRKPDHVPGLDDSEAGKGSGKCHKVAGNAIGPQKSQDGSGLDDGPYQHRSTPRGEFTIQLPDEDHDFSGNPNSVYFAQLVNAGGAVRELPKDELIIATPINAGMDNFFGWRYVWYLNEPGQQMQFTYRGILDIPRDMSGCDPKYVRWGDLNNDGLDDFFCVGDRGQVFVALNRGGNPPKFEGIGEILGPRGNQPAGVGGAPYTGDDVIITDIDADGRADYCLIDDGGNVRCRRNGGMGDRVSYWQGFLADQYNYDIVASGQGMGNKRGVRFADLNGDQRPDWTWVGNTGQVWTRINQRGDGAARGIAPDFLDRVQSHVGAGLSHEFVKFGHVFGTGRADYVTVTPDSGSDDHHNKRWRIKVWENQGGGKTKLKGDGDFYCDMRGLGYDDYVWVKSDGKMIVYRNKNDWNTGDHSHWMGVQDLFDAKAPRQAIHLADWDGDGKCDILVQNRQSGALTWWKNNYNNGNWDFQARGEIPNARCPGGWGVGLHDRNVRLADVNGDGLPDYLCLALDGRISGFQNAWTDGRSTPRDQGQIKYSEGADRANLRFADVENSGLADMIWLNKYTGRGRVFKNLGDGWSRADNSGSWIRWQNRGDLYSSVNRGPNVHFVDFEGSGRASIQSAEVWWNRCGDAGGDNNGEDESSYPDPNLPVPPEDQDDPDDIWRAISCSAVKDEGISAEDRWATSRADLALESLRRAYEADKDKPNQLDFSRYASRFFDGPPLFQCNLLLSRNGCDSHPPCAPGQTAAGFLILNSMVALSNMQWNFYDTIWKARQEITEKMAWFQTHFSPIEKEDVTVKILLDIVAIAFTSTAAPLWNQALKKTALFKDHPNRLGTLKDTVNGTIDKNWVAQNELTAYVGAIADAYTNATYNFNKGTFDGSNVPQFHRLMSGAKMLATAEDFLDVEQIRKQLKKSIYAQMVPIAWMKAGQLIGPVIAHSRGSSPRQGTCDAETGNLGQRICHQDGDTNYAYWIGGASDPDRNCLPISDAGGVCPEWTKKLPGESQFGVDALGQLSRDDIAIGAINTWVAKGYSYDPDAGMDLTDEALLNSIQDLNVRAPGLVRLPVCGRRVIENNWWAAYQSAGNGRSKLYPCDPDLF